MRSDRGTLKPDLLTHSERSAGFVLLAATATALTLANLPCGALIEHMQRAPFTVSLGGFAVRSSVHSLVTDGLMTLFFLIVGLEIQREIRDGELSDWRKGALPVAAALGGMLVPACLYVALNHRGPEAAGWAIPMATDIAFAAGVLSLLGNRVPGSLRVFLLALAVFDDLGAIVIITLVFSKSILLGGLAWGAIGALAVAVLRRAGAPSWVCIIPGLLVWWGFEHAGIHPTLAGVVVGLLAPSDRLPRVESAVAFAIMPLFAFMNAGVRIGGLDVHVPGGVSTAIGIVLGLFVGKPLGILAGGMLAVRLRVASLPQGIGWSHVGIAGCLGGIGFTMSLFVAMLAFQREELLAFAKLGILVGSIASALRGFRLGRAGLAP